MLRICRGPAHLVLIRDETASETNTNLRASPLLEEPRGEKRAEPSRTEPNRTFSYPYRTIREEEPRVSTLGKTPNGLA